MYQLPDLSVWRGRIDGGGETLRWHQAIKPLDLHENLTSSQPDHRSFALLGFCCDEGVRRNLGRTGAREGPAAIRKSLRNLCIHPDPAQTLLFDCGDVICSGEKLEAAQSMLGKKILQLLEAGYKPLVMGGGHEVAFGHFQGIYPFVSQRSQSVGIINLDAHFDLRKYDEQGNSGTPFLQISSVVKADGEDFNYLVLGIEESGNTQDLFNRARELNVGWCPRNEVDVKGNDSLIAAIDNFVSRVQNLYVTLDLDVINQAYAPGVSAPSPLGWTPEVILRSLQRIFSTEKVVSFDIAELNPSLDADARTARLAAGFIYEIVKMWR